MHIKEIRVYDIKNPWLYRIEKYVTVCNVATPRRLRGLTYNNSNNEVLRFFKYVRKSRVQSLNLKMVVLS